ncbi:MBL fold metallo-hydrolase [Halorubrum tebenquichense]|uniref:Beta-lactamase n=1 Tax=Halorubrum tebenquichense DSM 14210 TaxID=1227485 RepID=M0DNP6_9EURY|nr:MBL fold metallo-hydrolase [Halorubrum tebenquichense]ELZ35774.1 beta-lactamase [Halorubrum tebenquichense DSM 14210]
MKRIQLGNTVFEGENDVYLLDGETTALVDTGVALPEVREELVDGLDEYGLAFADVDAVVLTHWHPDHAGLAGEVQAESGADVYVHEADAALVDGSETPLFTDRDLQRETFERWGMPDADRERLTAFFGAVSADLSGRPADVTTFGDGETIRAGGVELEALHLPGHTAGLSGFAFDPRTVPDHDPVAGADATAEAFTGDALLPKYTPNVGGADVRVEGALAAYAESLARIVERDFDAAHPGHRWRIDDPSRRAATILDHHRHRTRRVVGVLDESGPATAWEVSAELFGSLEGIHVLHGPGEAFSHLDHLAAAGVVERDGPAYRLVDPDPDVAALFPTTPLDDLVDGGEDA